MWLHNKCEHIDPNQNHEGYVCKSRTKSLEKPFEKHLFGSTNAQETARITVGNSVGNTIDEISTLKSENSVLRERVLVLEDLLSAHDTKIKHYVSELENLRQELKEALDKNAESEPNLSQPLTEHPALQLRTISQANST